MNGNQMAHYRESIVDEAILFTSIHKYFPELVFCSEVLYQNNAFSVNNRWPLANKDPMVHCFFCPDVSMNDPVNNPTNTQKNIFFYGNLAYLYFVAIHSKRGTTFCFLNYSQGSTFHLVLKQSKNAALGCGSASFDFFGQNMIDPNPYSYAFRRNVLGELSNVG